MITYPMPIQRVTFSDDPVEEFKGALHNWQLHRLKHKHNRRYRKDGCVKCIRTTRRLGYAMAALETEGE